MKTPLYKKTTLSLQSFVFVYYVFAKADDGQRESGVPMLMMDRESGVLCVDETRGVLLHLPTALRTCGTPCDVVVSVKPRHTLPGPTLCWSGAASDGFRKVYNCFSPFSSISPVV